MEAASGYGCTAHCLAKHVHARCYAYKLMIL